MLLVISFAVFSLQFLAPGSPEQILMGTRPSTPESLAAMRERFNLNDPFIVQYGKWLTDAVRLDFGTSIRTGEPVLSAIRDRIDLTLWLGTYGFIIAMGLGVPLGILAAMKRRGPIDRAVVTVSVLGVSAPAFASSIFLLYLFAVVLDWFPTFGEGSGFIDRLYHLTLPAVALALSVMALVVKLTRAAMIETLEQDYVAFARARGLAPSRVIRAYALRNALIPVVTTGGLIFTVMLTGTVLVEVAFALQGVGALLVDSVNVKDVSVVQGIAIFIAIVIVLVNLLIDLLYPLIDPRIRFDRTSR